MLLPVPAVSDARGVLMVILVLVGVLLATAVWVYRDAKTSAEQGRPISCSVGVFRLRTPVSWFIACLLLWELFFPLYIENRHPA